MPSFRYKALASNGQMTRGHLDAPDRGQAVSMLRDRQLTLVEVIEQSSHASWLQRLAPGSSGGKLPLRDLVFIARQLDNLLQAGSELDRSLSIVAKLIIKKTTQILLEELIQQIRRGRSLADALASASGAFPDFFISMVRAGEGGGALAPAFKRLADILERQLQTRSRLASALIYPAILMVATISSIILIMTVVVPQFEPIFEQARQELPFLTRLVITLSRTTLIALPFLIPAVVLGSLAFLAWLRDPAGKRKWHETILRFPLIGSTILTSEMARLSYVLGALLQGGVPLINALAIAQGSLGNMRLRSAVAEVRDLVKNGVKISAAMDRQGIFPDMMVQLTSIAEESSRLGDTLLEVGRIYDNATETRMQRMVAVATPLATIGLGGMVALVLAAILLAVLKVNDLAF